MKKLLKSSVVMERLSFKISLKINVTPFVSWLPVEQIMTSNQKHNQSSLEETNHSSPMISKMNPCKELIGVQWLYCHRSHCLVGKESNV